MIRRHTRGTLWTSRIERTGTSAWPEMYGKLKELQAMVFLSPPGIEINLMTFTVASLAGGASPNAVEPEHHADVRAHFSDEEARTLIAAIALSGFMNRYNDTLGTVTDQESRDWAETHVTGLGWNIGKHTGGEDEQRAGPPLG